MNPDSSELPPLAWPEFTDETARLAWWRACVQAWREQWNNPAPVAPVNAKEIAALEQRLGCALPPLLRRYHETLGALELAERLCSVTPAKYASIEPLLAAYPGIFGLKLWLGRRGEDREVSYVGPIDDQLNANYQKVLEGFPFK